MPNNTNIKLQFEENYGYLLILEADDINHTLVKKNSVTKEYYQRILKILEMKLNGENKVKAVKKVWIDTLPFT